MFLAIRHVEVCLKHLGKNHGLRDSTDIPIRADWSPRVVFGEADPPQRESGTRCLQRAGGNTNAALPLSLTRRLGSPEFFIRLRHESL